VTNVRTGIVVGVDGSEASEAALEWASVMTDRFGPIRPFYAWEYPMAAMAPSPFGLGAVPASDEMQTAAEAAAAEFITDLDQIDLANPVVRRGDPAQLLLEESQDAELLVVGTRSRGPIRAALLGSVGRYLADHTSIPLAIVPHRGEASARPSPRHVVVGVDGSDASINALVWAARCCPDDAIITAVTTWQTPVDGPMWFADSRFDVTQFQTHARDTVNEAADKVCAEMGWDTDKIQREIAEGDPRWVMLAREGDCDLLVLGQRGRRGLQHLFLGSTTTALIHRPHCPIVVVPS